MPFIAKAFHPEVGDGYIDLLLPGELRRRLLNRGWDEKLKEVALIPGTVREPQWLFEEIREEWHEDFGPEKCLCYIARPNPSIIEAFEIAEVDVTDYFFVFVNPRKEIFEWGPESFMVEEELEGRFGRLIWKRE
jgi:hypothetical protein